MSIEFKIQSVIRRTEEIQEQYPNLVPSINYFLQSQNISKKGKSRKKKTAAVLIDQILADIQTE